ncbi:Protein LOL2 [Vitis vinifera]|uniref:Protein LOL2 n=1 Tax=Vitis vinifera TaxID=29760 RepID=A0A438EF26_VITVI|nr:Protein LOL2 [Vitis vinifera]
METEAETTGSRQEGLSPNHSAGNGRTPGEMRCYFVAEMAQMVCGSCRRLLSYPQGTRHVECSCCQTVNFVLEGSSLPFFLTKSWLLSIKKILFNISMLPFPAHQVGQVKCGSCAVLLMYPYGAPSVRCSSCRFVTEIGVCSLMALQP